ncbi:uncharacterized protein SCHCODRAFT_02627855 [Schizophyllum commune H4-8]|nr:uncharacterized protein SCHCODRAFT_02627855 [Schizophyllum commune H4-8]KAI5890998.1 hypothetical protein SCHCODRAFT_02627855 [Schizophyllum commune H4-8]
MRRSTRTAAKNKRSTLNSSPSGQDQPATDNATKRPAQRRQQRAQTARDGQRTRKTKEEAEEVTSALGDFEGVEHVPISPIHRLPFELLAEIFLQLRARIVAKEGPFPNPTSKIDASITRVCRAWRRVAYGTPSLWATLTANDLELVDSYLERYLPLSRGCLLDIVSQLRGDSLIELLDKLRPHASQWRAVRLLPHGRELGQILPLSTPSLEYVHVVAFGSNSTYNHVSLEFLEDASRLHHLHFDARSLSNFTLALPITSRLATLQLKVLFLSTTRILPILQQCNQTLIELDITAHAHGNTRWPSVGPVHLPALRRLVLEGKPCEILSAYITAPIIEGVTFDCVPSEANRALHRFLQRVPSAASCLRRLKSCYFQDFQAVEPLLQCLPLMTRLEELDLGDVEFKAIIAILNNLICSEDAPPSLPKLSAIMFTAYGTNVSTELPQLYEDFAKSRASQRIVCGVEVAELRRADVTLH